jgi:hypothetical protein
MDGTALACQSRSSETRAGIVALMGCGGVYDSTLYEDNGMEHLHRKEQFIGKDFGISSDSRKPVNLLKTKDLFFVLS